MSSALGFRSSGVQLLHSVWEAPSLGTLARQKLPVDLRQRLLLWGFGLSVIGQLWLWPIYLIAITQSLAIAVVLARWVRLQGASRKGACILNVFRRACETTYACIGCADVFLRELHAMFAGPQLDAVA
jgi:hypothetical protein